MYIMYLIHNRSSKWEGNEISELILGMPRQGKMKLYSCTAGAAPSGEIRLLKVQLDYLMIGTFMEYSLKHRPFLLLERQALHKS